MKLKKNLGAKIAALVASLTALGGIWALVYQNPPATASSAATSDATPQAGPGQHKPAIAKSNQSQTQAPKPHTRTHTSRSK